MINVIVLMIYLLLIITGLLHIKYLNISWSSINIKVYKRNITHTLTKTVFTSEIVF